MFEVNRRRVLRQHVEVEHHGLCFDLQPGSGDSVDCVAWMMMMTMMRCVTLHILLGQTWHRRKNLSSCQERTSPENFKHANIVSIDAWMARSPSPLCVYVFLAGDLDGTLSVPALQLNLLLALCPPCLRIPKTKRTSGRGKQTKQPDTLSIPR